MHPWMLIFVPCEVIVPDWGSEQAPLGTWSLCWAVKYSKYCFQSFTDEQTQFQKIQ